MNLGGDVKKATISGTLVYLLDQAGAETQEIALANQRVYFEVAGTKYSGTAATGNIYFSATTDANGAYTISVPVGAKAIAGNLKTDQICIEKDGKKTYLKNTSKALTVSADELRAEKIYAAIDNVLTDCQGTCIVKGKITYNAGIVEKGGVKEDGKVAAPAGVKVNIMATFDDNNVRTFITETKADGTYEITIPCYTNKSLADSVTISQFEANYTSLVNNNYLTVKAIYELKNAKKSTLKDGTQQVVDIDATQASKADPTTKNTKFTVKGQIKVAAEELTFSTTPKYENQVTGSKKGSKNFTADLNGGKFKLEIRHYKGSEVDSKIIYDLTVGDKGRYEKEVAMYDTWKYDEVKVFLVIDKFATENYTHYYRTAKYDDDNKWQSFPTTWVKMGSTLDGDSYPVEETYYASQKCAGTYELETAGTQPNAFFAITIDGTAGFTMSDDSKATLRGCSKEINGTKIDYDADDHQIYGNGLDY